jgi:hypothetical protein
MMIDNGKWEAGSVKTRINFPTPHCVLSTFHFTLPSPHPNQ